VDYNGNIKNQAIVSIVQTRREKLQEESDKKITFFGGVTLVFDLDSATLLYAIKKDIRDEIRLKKRIDYVNNMNDEGDDNAMRMSFETNGFYGPFASLHNSKH